MSISRAGEPLTIVRRLDRDNSSFIASVNAIGALSLSLLGLRLFIALKEEWTALGRKQLFFV